MTGLDFITGDRGEHRLTREQINGDKHLVAVEWFPDLIIETREELPSGDLIIRWEPACDMCADRDLGSLLLMDGTLTLCRTHMGQLQEEEITE